MIRSASNCVHKILETKQHSDCIRRILKTTARFLRNVSRGDHRQRTQVWGVAQSPQDLRPGAATHRVRRGPDRSGRRAARFWLAALWLAAAATRLQRQREAHWLAAAAASLATSTSRPRSLHANCLNPKPTTRSGFKLEPVCRPAAPLPASLHSPAAERHSRLVLTLTVWNHFQYSSPI